MVRQKNRIEQELNAPNVCPYNQEKKTMSGWGGGHKSQEEFLCSTLFIL